MGCVPGRPEDIVGQLPLGADDNVPALSIALAALALGLAFFLGLAALHAAAAMRVLARDRRIPHPLSPEMRQFRALLLTPLGPSTVRLAEEPDLPPSKLPEAAKSGADATAADGAGTGARRGAHDRGDAGVAVAADAAARTRSWSSPTTAPTTPPRSPGEHGAEVFTTVGNTEKKAGALNQALAEMFR